MKVSGGDVSRGVGDGYSTSSLVLAWDFLNLHSNRMTEEFNSCPKSGSYAEVTFK